MKRVIRKPAPERQAFTIRIERRLAEEVTELAERQLWSVSHTLALLVERALAAKLLGR